MSYRIAVIQFPGNNCEVETARAVRRAGMDAEIFRWNRPSAELSQFDGFVLGGGFGYEDRGRSGVVAAQDPLMKTLKSESEKGKPILGICNGAQALVEAGFIPGVNGYKLAMALARNKRMKDGKVLGTGYYNTWVHVKHSAPVGRSAFTLNMPEKAVKPIPVAHGEGRFTTEDNALFEQMVSNHQVLFRYCNNAGAVIDEFPTNPNGAMYNIAALCNPAGNVMAIMPHPERGVTPPLSEVFDSMRVYIERGSKPYVAPVALHVSYQDSRASYHIGAHSFEIMVDLIITDNEAFTIESALHDMGFAGLTLGRRTYWEIQHAASVKNPEKLAEQIMRTGALFNSNKENALLRSVDRVCTFSLEDGLVPAAAEPQPAFACIVFDKEDSVGASKLSTLQNTFGLKEVTAVRRGVYWHATLTGRDPQETFEKILDSHVLYNPHSQECVVVK